MTTAPMSAHAVSQAPAKAILLSVSAILLFGMMDASVKAVTPLSGTAPALWARYTGQMLVVLVLVLPRLRRVVRSNYLGLQIARSVLLMSATLFFFFAIGRSSLATASAVMSTNPLLITLGAALFLGERLGPRRIGAVVAAMIGALLVIRPGSDVFEPAALAAFLAAICFASYALITRRVGPDENVWTSLFYTGLVGAILTSCAVPFFWTPLTWEIAAWMCAIAGFGTVGQLLLIRALSLAEAGMLAPFNYTGLVFAVIMGIVAFGEWPDLWTLIGALVIAGAGIYVWHREVRVR